MISIRNRTNVANGSTKIAHTTPKTQTSATNTANKLACRICLDDDQSESPLIRPCACKGTVALIHENCLKRWVEMNHDMVCNICKDPYEMESAGWKPVKEWNCPRALSDSWEDVLDFRCAIGWLVYFSRFAFLAVKYGIDDTTEGIRSVVGSGGWHKLWWFAFWMNFLYYGAVTILVIDQWIVENQMYRFRDRNKYKTTSDKSSSLYTTASDTTISHCTTTTLKHRDQK